MKKIGLCNSIMYHHLIHMHNNCNDDHFAQVLWVKTKIY